MLRFLHLVIETALMVGHEDTGQIQEQRHLVVGKHFHILSAEFHLAKKMSDMR